MPNLQAARKAHRHSQRRRTINDRWRRTYKAAVKSVREAIAAGDAAAASAALGTAQKALDRSARRNILHPKTAARQKSRLQRAIQKISA